MHRVEIAVDATGYETWVADESAASQLRARILAAADRTPQQPPPARPSTPQHRRCPCLSVVQIPVASLTQQRPVAAWCFAPRLRARRIAAASHALQLRFGLPCATTHSSSRRMCSNHDGDLIW